MTVIEIINSNPVAATLINESPNELIEIVSTFKKISGDVKIRTKSNIRQIIANK